MEFPEYKVVLDDFKLVSVLTVGLLAVFWLFPESSKIASWLLSPVLWLMLESASLDNWLVYELPTDSSDP